MRDVLLECDMVGAGGGVAIDQARLTDQQRVAVVLQGAALLSQLEHGGWIAASGWREARLTDDGLLRVPSIQRGRSDELVQLALARLLRRAFRTEGQVAGRGEARSAARYLLERWQQILAPSSADQAVTDVLTAAPFLWRDNFTRARRALVAEHSADGRSHLWLAGPGAARTRFLAGGRGLEEVRLSWPAPGPATCGMAGAPARIPRRSPSAADGVRRRWPGAGILREAAGRSCPMRAACSPSAVTLRPCKS